MHVRPGLLLPTLMLVALTQMTSSHAQTCSCGPDYCADTPSYSKALAFKKQKLSKEYPNRLVALFDKVDRCEASIATSPDGFSLFRRAKDGTIAVDTWTDDNEKIGASDLELGALTDCRVIISRRAFACCGSQPYDQRSDYDKALDVNRTATLICGK